MVSATIRAEPLYSRYPLPLGIAVFLAQVALGIVLFSTFQDYVPRALGVGTAWPGYLLAAYGAGRFLFETPTGAISDRIERKFGLLAGLLLMIPAVTAMAFVEDRYVFLAAAALLGFGTSFMWPATYAIAADLYPPNRRARVIGFLNVGQLTGFGVGALGSAQIIDNVTWEQFALAFSALAAAALATAAGIPRYRSRLPASVRTRRPSLVDVMSVRLVLLSGIFLATSTSLAMSVPAIRPYGTEELGVEFSTLTIALIPAIVVGAVLYVPAGLLADRIGRGGPYIAGLLLMAAGLFWVASIDTLGVAVVAAAVVIGGNVVIVPASHAAVFDLAPASHRGTLIGLNVALTGLGLTIGPAISGPIVQSAGAPAALRVAALVGLATAAALAVYARIFRLGPPAVAPIPTSD
ncbi:MAG: MFS transporter [Dehalococcoidia bacterium]